MIKRYYKAELLSIKEKVTRTTMLCYVSFLPDPESAFDMMLDVIDEHEGEDKCNVAVVSFERFYG